MKQKNKSKPLVYLDTSVFAGKVLIKDAEDKSCALLWKEITNRKYRNFQFITSIFTLIELAELISRKKSKMKAKAVLFDIMNNPDLPISLMGPEKAHKVSKNKEFFDIDLLIANMINTALRYNLPGFDTIHAHTVKTLKEKAIIVVSKDKHFKRFKKIKNVKEVLKASQFLKKYPPSKNSNNKSCEIK